MVGQLVLWNEDLDVDYEIVGIAEELDDSADGVLALLGELEHLDVDDEAVELGGGGDLAGLDADAVEVGRGGLGQLHAVGNFDPLLDALILRDDVLAAASDAELADDGDMGAFEDLDDFAVGAAAGF